VRVVLDRVRADAGEEPSTRMRLLLHVAEALLADGDRAEHHFRLATVDPAGQEWPFERAIARLHYGTWLRRARRPRDARGVLSAAASAFADLGAAGAARLATRELRAGGQHDEPVGPTPLSVLTPQERQVAELAARGLRNREIAEHLFISVRTVDAHLHSVYPKLGISGRHQLRDAAGRT
jgi:DNA-binding CsgD family transcriptional regulator